MSSKSELKDLQLKLNKLTVSSLQRGPQSCTTDNLNGSNSCSEVCNQTCQCQCSAVR
jgi:hypothetical protein